MKLTLKQKTGLILLFIILSISAVYNILKVILMYDFLTL